MLRSSVSYLKFWIFHRKYSEANLCFITKACEPGPGTMRMCSLVLLLITCSLRLDDFALNGIRMREERYYTPPAEDGLGLIHIVTLVYF